MQSIPYQPHIKNQNDKVKIKENPGFLLAQAGLHHYAASMAGKQALPMVAGLGNTGENKPGFLLSQE